MWFHKTPGRAMFLQDYALVTVQSGNFHHFCGADVLLGASHSFSTRMSSSRGGAGTTAGPSRARFLDVATSTLKHPSRQHPPDTLAILIGNFQHLFDIASDFTYDEMCSVAHKSREIRRTSRGGARLLLEEYVGRSSKRPGRVVCSKSSVCVSVVQTPGEDLGGLPPASGLDACSSKGGRVMVTHSRHSVRTRCLSVTGGDTPRRPGGANQHGDSASLRRPTGDLRPSDQPFRAFRTRTYIGDREAPRSPSVRSGLWSSVRQSSIVRPRDTSVREPSRLRVAIVTSTPPTPCGIATFSMALGRAMQDSGATINLVRIVDRAEERPTLSLGVIAVMVSSQPSSIRNVAQVLNQFDAVVIQHEYGLYGGPDGSDVVRLMRQVTVPMVVVLHTVLPHPSGHQRHVLNTIIARADQVVVMTQNAQQTLMRTNTVGETPIVVIPHGATNVADDSPNLTSERPVILTWGLLSPGKGIEWMIDALVALRDISPPPRYIVAGRTHPKVQARQGESYREHLVERARKRGVSDLVEFEDVYRDSASLRRLIMRADVVVLPYDSPDQATSGVLVDALVADRPVVATAFPHAVEALGNGAGLVVNQRDSEALSVAVRWMLTHPEEARVMAQSARSNGPDFSWPVVARSYLEVIGRLVAARSPA